MKNAFSSLAACLLVGSYFPTIAQPNVRLYKPPIDATIVNLKQYTMEKPFDGSLFNVFAGTQYDPYGHFWVYTKPHFLKVSGNGVLLANVLYDINPNSNLNIQYKTVDIAAGDATNGNGNQYYITCLGQPFQPTYNVFNQPTPIITPSGETNRIVILTVDDSGTPVQPTIEIKNFDPAAPAPATGYGVYPISSLYTQVAGVNYLYICGYIRTANQYTPYWPSYSFGSYQPNFYSQKKSFVICVDVDDNSANYGQVVGARVFDTPIDPNIEEYHRKDYDMAMRMKEIKYGNGGAAYPYLNYIFVTGSVNAQTGGTPGSNIVRSGTMNMVLEPITLNTIFAQSNVISPGNGDGGGEGEYGIDMIENPNPPYNKYIISNKFNENVEPNDFMDEGLDAVPYSMGITQVDDGFGLGPRFFCNNFNGWGLKVMESFVPPAGGNMSFTIAGMVNNDPQFSDIVPFLVDVQVDNNLIATSGIIDNGISRKYNTSSGTGDPFSVYNSYYGMGMGLSNIAYHSKFAGRGAARNMVMMVPRWDNNRLLIKYMRTTNPANFDINAGCGMENLSPDFQAQQLDFPIGISDGPVDFYYQYLNVNTNTIPLIDVGCTADGSRPSGIEEKVIGKVSLHPNPAGDVLHITGIAEAQYVIKDITGRTLQSGKLAATNTVNIEKLPTGIYLLHLNVKGKQEVLKFSKQ